MGRFVPHWMDALPRGIIPPELQDPTGANARILDKLSFVDMAALPRGIVSPKDQDPTGALARAAARLPAIDWSQLDPMTGLARRSFPTVDNASSQARPVLSGGLSTRSATSSGPTWETLVGTASQPLELSGSLHAPAEPIPSIDWEEPVQVANLPALNSSLNENVTITFNNTRYAARDSAGVLYVVYSAGGNLSLLRLLPEEGATWDFIFRWRARSGAVQYHYPALTSMRKAGSLAMVCVGRQGSETSQQIYVALLRNAHETPRVQVDIKKISGDLHSCSYPGILYNKDADTLHIAFDGKNPDEDISGAFHAWSVTDGVSWGYEQVNLLTQYNCRFAAVAVLDQTIVLAWRYETIDNEDQIVVAARSGQLQSLTIDWRKELYLAGNIAIETESNPADVLFDVLFPRLSDRSAKDPGLWNSSDRFYLGFHYALNTYIAEATNFIVNYGDSSNQLRAWTLCPSNETEPPRSEYATSEPINSYTTSHAFVHGVSNSSFSVVVWVAETKDTYPKKLGQYGAIASNPGPLNETVWYTMTDDLSGFSSEESFQVEGMRVSGAIPTGSEFTLILTGPFHIPMVQVDYHIAIDSADSTGKPYEDEYGDISGFYRVIDVQLSVDSHDGEITQKIKLKNLDRPGRMIKDLVSIRNVPVLLRVYTEYASTRQPSVLLDSENNVHLFWFQSDRIDREDWDSSTRLKLYHRKGHIESST
jgi:hypothetical protein